jgi:uncharacterized protein YndB with AHSA1/START domain
MDPFTVERTIWIAASPERVWQAITDPAQLVQWYAPGCPWDIPALRAGAAVRFHNTPTDVQTATLDLVQPPQRLRLRWAPEADYPATQLVTTLALAPENNGTRVTITETGYAALPAHLRPARLDQASTGYAASLAALKTLLEA